MNKYVRIVTVVLVILVGGFFVYRSTSNKIEQLRGSQDSLSLELADRWGAGLPDGYTKEVDDRLDTDGTLYAKLTYSKSIADLLAKWEPVDETLAADFTAIAPADAPMPPVGDWLGYELTDGDARLVLLYDPAAYVLYVVESQPQ
ncbi:hypothetical protein ACTQ33_00410 [Candidatus Avoscillospira sp. LCP25S3_F1]|uniref:hypothetical protein n=1 Tax=Candidatus Avoscillospira sp. LCP25S3_F1 TaxID=3438825 RepID=UPI003F93771C